MRALVALTMILAAGCKPTEVAMVAVSDIAAAAMPSVRIAVASTVSAPQTRCVCLDGACTGDELAAAWPLTAGLRPGRDASSPFTVDLEGHDGADCGGNVVTAQRARVRFVSHRRLLLRMGLLASCIGVVCGDPDTTCDAGQCVPIDFPTQDIGDGDPAGQVDAAVPDAAMPDLAAADLSTPPAPALIAVDTGATGTFGRPSIVYDSTGTYEIAYVDGAAGALRAARLDPFLAYTLLGAGVMLTNARPDLVSASANGTLFAQVVGTSAGTLLGNVIGLPPGPVTQTGLTMGLGHGLVVTPTGLRSFINDGGTIQAYDVNPSSLAYGMATTVVSTASEYLRATGDGQHWSFWFDNDAASHMSVQREADAVPLANTNIVQEIAVTHTADHYFAVASGSATGANILWTGIPVTGAATLPALQAFSPPLGVASTSLTVGADGTDLVVAYTNADGIHEVVAVPSVTPPALTVTSTRTLFVPAPGDTVTGVAYAASPTQGGGAYVWRVTGPGGDHILAQRRSATVP